MTKDYKFCPKCNNAIDNKTIQCPYCREKIGINFGYESTSGYKNTNNKTAPEQFKKSKGCFIFFIIFFILPFIGSIISFILKLLSSLFD